VPNDVTLELSDPLELYVVTADGVPDSVCEMDALPDSVALGHAVKEELAEGEILELGELVKETEGLPVTEERPEELTVTV
jgi:hypothetical protein